MTCFDEHCHKLLGMSADELFEIESNNDMTAFTDTWKKSLFTTHVIKVRAKSEVWEEKTRVKCSIVDMQPVNYATECKNMLERIRLYGV